MDFRFRHYFGIISLLIVLCDTRAAYSQNSFRAIVKDSASGETIPGATAVVKGTSNGAASDEGGSLTIHNIPNGEQQIVFSFIGYETIEREFVFPLAGSEPVTILLSPTAELDEIIVEGTRSNRSIASIPTRVEVLTEEIDEAASMDPSKVAHLLTHSTGIQVQQTSATSNTANVRIQGLDGRYTQILKDGFPLYGGFSGSLSIMQIPPLDLRQVEYIKGSASTLYGGGAIAGLINLISKEPTKKETLLHINGSHIGAFDVNAFVSRMVSKKIGFTLLAQRNTHKAFDADKDGFTDMPQLTKYNINPKLFFYFSKKTKLSVGGTFTDETRQGGDMRQLGDAKPDSAHFYKESNDVQRTTTQLRLDHDLSEKLLLTVRNSFNIFKRNFYIIPSPALTAIGFDGRQLSSFSEIALTHKRKQNVLITGLNYYSDDFKEKNVPVGVAPRDEGYNTIGAFANYAFDLSKMVAIEAGVRTDYVLDDKLFVLPRVSALFKWTDKLTTRIGGGMGYRNPTIFNQEAELYAYDGILPIDKKGVNAEESYGGGVDLGYKTPLGDKFFININQMFFYTHVDHPLVLRQFNPFLMEFVNANGWTRSYGGETFFKFGFYDFVLFAGYTYTNATNHFSGAETRVTQTPMHSLKGDLLYSLPGKWRIGVDYEFKSSQLLSNGTQTPSFWTYGALVEYTWKQFTVLGNVENFTNVRQTKYQSLRSGPYGTPQFTEVWAPLDGIVFNAGVKVRL